MSIDDRTTYDWESFRAARAVPDEVRQRLGDRHEILLEEVRTSLPQVLEREGSIDISVHDDLHTPDHRRWEYRLVWPRLRAGGLLVSDDANRAWLAFATTIGAGPATANVDRIVRLRKPQRAVPIPAGTAPRRSNG